VDRTHSRKDVNIRRKDRWNLLFIASMWFQDLFNYDFRRTEQCIIPYAAQEDGTTTAAVMKSSLAAER
jgi:uncharacterized radical SAM superfamily Fe-S cluster-containing enzyme